jgi:hypothetical protein
MIHRKHPGGDAARDPRAAESNAEVAQLVGRVFESAPVEERARLLEHLLRPLGALSLVAIANGVFAKILFQNPGRDLHIRLEDVQAMQPGDIVALVDFVQQGSVEVVDGLARMLASSPFMAGSATVALLTLVLLRRARRQRAGAGDGRERPDAEPRT